jgi:hypothetical protein
MKEIEKVGTEKETKLEGRKGGRVEKVRKKFERRKKGTEKERKGVRRRGRMKVRKNER